MTIQACATIIARRPDEHPHPSPRMPKSTCVTPQLEKLVNTWIPTCPQVKDPREGRWTDGTMSMITQAPRAVYGNSKQKAT